MGKDNLKVIATELVTRVRKSVTIDWTLRESARAEIKVLVKRILRKHGYPPDLQDEATKLVLRPQQTKYHRFLEISLDRRPTTKRMAANGDRSHCTFECV